MLLSFDSGVSALEQFQQGLNVIANNIANVNTVAFKGSTVNFSDTLSQTLGTNAAGSQQIGYGVSTASIQNQFNQGTFSYTGSPSNLAISGSGFFLVKDPSSGNTYATRDGSFTMDANGYLINSQGMRLQGTTGGSSTTVGDIQVTNAGATNTAATVSSFTINGTTGQITSNLSDGEQVATGQVLLQNYTTPSQLVKAGNNLYTNLAAAGGLTSPVAPSSTGPGTLQVGYLESSNVDLAAQLTSLITMQRAYEANSKSVTTSDDILQTLVNLKR